MSDAQRTAHVDTFVRDHLPPRELWPRHGLVRRARAVIPGPVSTRAARCSTPGSRAASAIGPRFITPTAPGRTSACSKPRIASRTCSSTTSASCRAAACCCGRANQPMLVACWFGVLKAGGVAVTTMPLLRVRELGDIIDQAQVSAGHHRRARGRGSRDARWPGAKRARRALQHCPRSDRSTR